MSQNILAFDGLVVTRPASPGVTSLAALPVGSSGRVLAVDGRSSVARRLMEMGVVPGAPVRVVKTAPLGDPIEVRVRGYSLALRKNEAQTISVMGDEI